MMAVSGVPARPAPGRVALGVTVGALVAFLADVALLALVDAGLGVIPRVPLQPGSTANLAPVDPLLVAIAVLPAAIGAGAVYALLSRRFASPARPFVAISAAVFVILLA